MYALYHTTDIESFKKIVKSNKLISMDLNNTDLSSTKGGGFGSGGWPGIYLSLLYKDEKMKILLQMMK